MKLSNLLILILIVSSSCTLLYREVRYYDADVTDHQIFPFTEILPADTAFYFAAGNKRIFDTLKITYRKDSAKLLNEIIEQSSTHAFLVIRNDSILFEQYYEGYQRSDISTFFSVSKSVTSLLMGIAIDEGYIESVHDPITKYIPELKGKDPNFEKLTIEYLLNMRSGMRYNEAYGNPFSHMARLYYGTNQLGKLKRMKFDYEPGTVHDYQSSSTALLGIAIEKATGKELGQYLEEKVWQPLGMENSATWSVDDRRHRSAKAYGCLNATAIDLAKIGRLYLNDGQWNEQQVLSKEWVQNTATPDVNNDGYQYQWRSFGGDGLKNGERYFKDSISAVNIMSDVYESKYKYFKAWKDENAPDPNNPWRIVVYTNSYFALGIMKQVLYIDPDKSLIIVRLGRTGDNNYAGLMYNIGKAL